MKEDAYTDIICRGFCKYYKGGREELHCKGYEVLMSNFTPRELQSLIALSDIHHGNIVDTIPSENEELRNSVCGQCEFFIDGCDYADDRSGPPCGGYILLLAFLSRQK